MARTIRVTVHYELEVDIDTLISECDIGLGPDITDDEVRWTAEGFFDADSCVPRWARAAVRIID